MTEEEWLEGDDPVGMWEFMSDTVSDRKWRLLAVALCRSIWWLLPDPRSRTAVEVAERFADGEASEDERVDACVAANAADVIGVNEAATQAAVHAGMMSHHLYGSFESAFEALVAVDIDPSGSMAKMVRDIFGNPFRPIAFNPAWRTDTAVTFARTMYEAREFGAMPILADALQDAGCEDPDVLNHCRDVNQTHVRGCWVVDLVLGKE